MRRERPLPVECTDVLEAFRKSCFDYDHGVPELAAAIGMSPATLYNKANTNDTAHPATLADAVLVMRTTGSSLIPQALAHLAGGAFVKLPVRGRLDDKDLCRLVAVWMREQGQFFAQFEAALADGNVTPKENRDITAQAHKVVTACLDLVGRVEAMAGRGA